ncbi:hypothetical protein BMS3Bbin06_00035 [bacterium BMS3Bbin06]|nr:hypothetical protein BMS3Bbin06_00035 [bacterium BMS3Bbin06]
MKRYLSIVLGLLFVLGLASSAYAVHAQIPAETQAVVAKGATQLTIGGSIRARMDYRSNLSDQLDNGSGDEHFARTDARVRLKIDVKVSDKTTGRVHLDNSWVWGTSSESKGNYKEGNGRVKGGFNIIEAWIQHVNGPVGFKIGHMPLALGNKLFFDHSLWGDDGVVVFANPNKQVHVFGVFAKFRESKGGINDDSTGYVIAGNYKAGNLGVGGDVTYVDDQVGAIHLWNIALRGNGNVAGLKLRGEVDLQTGKVTDAGRDFGGYAFLFGADYKLGNTKLSGIVAYGSGDDNPNDNKIDEFVTSLSPVPYDYAGYLYHYRMKTACSNGALVAGACNGGIANTFTVKVGANTKVSKELSVAGSIAYLQAAEDISINGGTPDNNLGWEFDGKVKYKLDRNLSLTLQGGYFAVGDAYNHANGQSDDAWGTRLTTQLSF